MAVDNRGERNRPIYASVGAPTDAEDLTYLGELATTVGTRRAGTSSDRQSLESAWLFNGLQWFETDTGATYVYADGWVLAYNALPRLRMTRPLAGISAGISFSGVPMSSFAQENGSLFTGTTGFTTAITGRYMVNMKVSTPNSPAGTRRVVGIAPSSAPGSVVTQSPGLGAANDSFSAGIDHTSEVTLQAGTPYSVVAASSNPLNFSNFDISVRLIAPTTIG